MDEEERNYVWLVLLLTKVAVDRVRRDFINRWNGVHGKLRPWLDLPHNGKDLLTKFKPLPYEKVKVESGDTSHWDLSLLVKVFLHSRPPFVTEKKFVKSLECLRDTRNTISHTSNGKIATADFKKMRSDACNALILFGATAADFKQVDQEMKRPLNELTSLMKDDDILREKRTISDYLKASIKRQTEFQPKFTASHLFKNAKTDDIFTNLVMQFGRKSLPEGTHRRELLPKYSNRSGTSVERCQDIFIPDKKENLDRPKSVLVTGKAGIGKSFFCQKLVRDWADDKLFQEQSLNADYGFDFVYLLSFRNLNLIHEEELTLRDVLNRCSLLDERSDIDEALFEYLLQHQERVLFVLDGYDEYVQRESITSDSIDTKYQDNPQRAMPVSALLSKLLKRKIFGNAVVMVTSRPDEANELGVKDFDKQVEIVGFSKEQAVEFIRRHFKSNKKVGNDVINHVEENGDLLSLAYVPMFCFLICWCMEWHAELKPDLSITMTELLFEFVEPFLKKHHPKSKYRPNQIPEHGGECPDGISATLENLSKLAVETMKSKKFTFNEDDFTRYGFNAEEIKDLKASGLLTSGPAIRISAGKITHCYCFIHVTLQEYLAALWYVQNEQVPSANEIKSEMVFQFFAGLCRKLKCRELLEKFFSLLNANNYNKKCFKLIYEYGDEEVGAEMINAYPGVFCISQCEISFTDKQKFAAFFLNTINTYLEKFSKHRDFNIRELYLVLFLFDDSYKLVVDSLNHPYCPITSLRCRLPYIFTGESHEKLELFLKSLTSSNIIHLKFEFSSACNVYFLPGIENALLDQNCKITALTLDYTWVDWNDSQLIEELDEFSKSLRSSTKITIYLSLFITL